MTHDNGAYVVLIERDEIDGGWTAEVLTNPGCVSQGDTPWQALSWLADALEAITEVEADSFKYGSYRNGLDRGMKQSEYVKLLEEIVDTYVDHISWRCQYRERYHECRCGLDEMMARIGRATIPVDDPEAPRDSTTLVSRQLGPTPSGQKAAKAQPAGLPEQAQAPEATP